MSKYCFNCMSSLDDVTVCPVCGYDNSKAVPSHHLLPGTILNDKFYVGKALGEGGFGITYIGFDLRLDMKVAVKEFYPNGFVNRNNTLSSKISDIVSESRKDFFESGKERFLKEAKILGKFSGEAGIVDVRDFFEENNTAYIIMEYLDGVDLKTYLKNNGTLTPERTIELLMPVMNSLKKVHAQGLIHRDISPDNIMIIGDKVKLLDFGAARTVSAAANKSLSVMLKPGYAPEEQYRSKGVQGPWTDIYALCATMYKCITGITPDDATQRVFSDEVKTPSALNIPIKPQIEKAIMRGMSVHQADRYQSVEELIRGFQGVEIAVSGSDKTVSPIKEISDDKETVFVPEPLENNTVLADQDVTILGEDTKQEPAKTEERSVQVSSEPVKYESVNSEPIKEEKTKGKGKIKWLILIVSILIIAGIVLMIVIPKGTAKDPESEDTTTYSVEYEEEDEKDIIEMSDNVLDTTFEFEGVVYQLPCELHTFLDEGWGIATADLTPDTLIPSDTYVPLKLDCGEIEIMYAVNISDDYVPLEQCLVMGLMYTNEWDNYFRIAQDIGIESDYDDVIYKLGAPDKSEGNNIAYMNEDMTCGVGLEFDSDNKCTGISLLNTSGADMSSLNEYSIPDTTTDEYNPRVWIEGVYYDFPVTIDELTDNGWQIDSLCEEEKYEEYDCVIMYREGHSTYFYIDANCESVDDIDYIYGVTADVQENVGVWVGEGSDEISFVHSKDDVDSMINTGFINYVNGNDYWYNYTDDACDIYIIVDGETESVEKISALFY